MTRLECFIWKWIICPIMGHASVIKCVFGDKYTCNQCGRTIDYEDLNTSIFRPRKKK